MTTSKKKKKSARERRVLVASIICAGLIVAGSTFAWFTSTDEVTNRLSASAEYGVAIAESFQPPENWVPGQEINKDASAVNTGNVDAFVRMWLDGDMRLLQQNKLEASATTGMVAAVNSVTLPATDVTDSNLISMGLTKQDNSDNYYKTLSKTQTINPNVSASGDMYGYAGNYSEPYSEVQAMQSSRLAYAPANAKYSFELKEETTLPIYVSKDSAAAVLEEVTIPVGTLVIVTDDNTAKATGNPATITSGTLSVAKTSAVTVTSSSGATKDYTNVVYVPNVTTGTGANDFAKAPIKNVEYESFTPMTDGLYLFLRNEDGTSISDPEFSGYYVDGIDDTNETPATGTYYALNTDTQGANRSDYTVKGATSATYDKPITVEIIDGVIRSVTPSNYLELYTAKYNDVAADLKWYYDNTDSKERIIALYDKDSSGDFDKDSDIAVIINLANVKDTTNTGAETWTAIGGTTSAAPTGMTGVTGTYSASDLAFYYNNDVEAGDTTAKLVDKVKLYDGVTNKAYLAFDFDLNVHLESIQVTMDENGKEEDTAVKSGWTATSGTTITGAKGERDTGAQNEINSVTWTASTP